METICDQFRRNPGVNPRTGRAIQIGGPTYNALIHECTGVLLPAGVIFPTIPPVRVPSPRAGQMGIPGPQPRVPMHQPRMPVIPTVPQLRVPVTPTVTQPRIPIPQPRVPVTRPRAPIIPTVPQPRIPVTPTVPQPRVTIPQPHVPIPQPRVPITQPQIAIQQPRVPVTQPQAVIQQPRVPVTQPQIAIQIPRAVPIQQPQVPITQTQIPGAVPTDLPQPRALIPGAVSPKESLRRELSTRTNYPIARGYDYREREELFEHLVGRFTGDRLHVFYTLLRALENNNYVGFPDTGEVKLIAEYIMTEFQRENITQFAAAMEIFHIDHMATFLDYLWYRSNTNEHTGQRGQLTHAARTTAPTLTREEMLDVLGPVYTGFKTDRASLLYSIITGLALRDNGLRPNPERYAQLSRYPPNLVWYLATALFNPWKTKRDPITNDVVPPDAIYERLASLPVSPIENVILSVGEDNVDALMAQYDIVIPRQFMDRDDYDPFTQWHKVKIFLGQMMDYATIIQRPHNLPPPPPYFTLRQEYRGRTNDLFDLFAQYTTRELIQAYWEPKSWERRIDVIREIIDDIHGAPQWFETHETCQNDDAVTIEGDQYGEVNKNNPNDPTIAYGRRGYYRCYQVSELLKFFRVDEHGDFHFYVPDYNPTIRTPDPLTGQPYQREFSVNDMKDLESLLEEYYDRTVTQIVRELLTIIGQGLERIEREGVNRVIRNLSNSYNDATPTQQHLIKQFVAWLFFYGIWMRFWKGPGHPWPRMIGGGGADVCEAAIRSEHIFVQNAVYTELSLRIDQDPFVKQWIEHLPKIRNVQRVEEGGTIEVDGKLIEYLNNLILGEECMGFGGDIITEMGHFFATQVVQVPDFNEFINEMLPELLRIEAEVVERQLAIIRHPITNAEIRRRFDTLSQRQIELRRPVPRLPPFDITRIQTNIHTLT